MFMPIPCHFCNQPFHVHYMSRIIHVHHPQLTHPLTHAYLFTSCFNLIIQSNICQTSKNRENIKQGRTLAQLLAQAERSHSGERDSRSGELLSPRRELDKQEQWPFAHSRLGETPSPERDTPSLKIRFGRLSDN